MVRYVHCCGLVFALRGREVYEMELYMRANGMVVRNKNLWFCKRRVREKEGYVFA